MMVLLQWLFVVFFFLPFIFGLAKVITILIHGR